MASVTAFTADRMKQIEDTTVVSGLVGPDGHLLLSTREGTEIDAGDVIGPPGPGFNYRGAWTPDTAYEVNDIVTSEGSTFIVLTAHTSSTDIPTDEAPGPNLALWAIKGEDGTIGVDGTPGDTAIPAGTISLWGSDIAPVNWLICDGSAVSRADYPSLFDAIGIKYGAGDGVNTFNLPNLKGRTPVGKDSAQTEFDTLGETGGAKTHTLTIAEMPSHKHDINTKYAGTATRQEVGMGDTSSGTGGFGTNAIQPTGGGGAHNNLQPYVVMNFIIKVTAGETPGDSELAQRLSELESKFSAMPAGAITAWAGETAPTNWLICNGAAVSRTTYASLFAAIGTKYGVGDGVSTFNLPDLRGRVPTGKNSGQIDFSQLGNAGGAMSHTHSHMSPIGVSGGLLYPISPDAPPMDDLGSYQFHSTQSVWLGESPSQRAANLVLYSVISSAAGTLPPYQVVNYIIKFTNGDTKGDSQLTQRVAALEAQITANALLSRDVLNRTQRVLSGGGIRRVMSNGIAWTERFITVGLGQRPLTPSGYYDITMPPDGTVIPVVGSPTVTSVTVAGGLIPMTAWEGLYYDVPLGSTYPSDPSRFRIVMHTAGVPTDLPPTYILIAVRNNDPYSAIITWGDGRSQDYWRGFTPQNGWAQYSGYSPIGWRYDDAGTISLRGLITAGAVGTIIDFGAVRGVDAPAIFFQPGAAGLCRIDVLADGKVSVINYPVGGGNQWVSLEKITWYPRGYA